MNEILRVGSVRLVICSAILLMLVTSALAGKPRFRITKRVSTHKTSAPHIAAAAAFDTKRGRMIMFGNLAPPGEDKKSGLITYDPAKDEFGMITTAGASPSGVAYPSMVYEPKRDALYLFGGWEQDATEPTDELWTLQLGDGGRKSWRRLSNVKNAPPARNGGVMVIDRSRDRLVLHGGDGGPHPQNGFTPLDDLWSYDLATERWKKLSPVGSPPDPRWNHSATIDHASGKMYLFGGTGYTSTLRLVRDRDLFILDLDSLNWTRQRCWGECPDSRQGATLTFDEATAALVLVGGLRTSDEGPSGTTSVWIYDLVTSRWSEMENVYRKFRRAHTAAYDPIGEQHIVHGGQTAWVRRNHYKRGQPLYDTVLISVKPVE